MILNKITKVYQIISLYGLHFCAFRAQYEVRRKLGLLKRKYPTRLWSQITLSDFVGTQVEHLPKSFLQSHKSNGKRFFFEYGNPPKPDKSYQEKILTKADEILRNRFQYFFNEYYELGAGPDWFVNPLTGKRADSSKHWCDTNFFDRNVGDIKFIWEPSRFAWVYALVRAFAVKRDTKYVAKFWLLFESWLEANQPNMGPNYACGQECSIRLMAMCFAYYAFANDSETTSQRQTKLVLAMANHAERIEKNISFAVSTRTNHSLTEAAGLYTVGLLFPEFKSADSWLKLGKKILTEDGLKQIYEDGSYIQQAMNYHRLMLQDFLWVMRLGQLNNEPFCTELISRIAKAVEFLYQMQDEICGRVPNYGSNDGAIILPLNTCDYLDYRPVLQSMNYLFNNTKLYESGPWDEDLIWLFGPDASKAPIKPCKRIDSLFKTGGYYTLRNNDSWAMMRCHSFKDRPSHADMLHLDLWWKGINILRDSGTYMYNCDQPWQDYFSDTASHNTITINNMSQMTKISKFMWLDWTKARFIPHKKNDSTLLKVIQGEHYSYCRNGRNVVHRRAVLSCCNRYWLVVDDVLGDGDYQVVLNWQLWDMNYNLVDNCISIDTDYGVVDLAVLSHAKDFYLECIRGNADRTAGWHSLYYGNRKPAPVIVYTVKSELPLRLVTIVSLGDHLKNTVWNEQNMVSWSGHKSGRNYTVTLRAAGDSQQDTFVSIKQVQRK